MGIGGGLDDRQFGARLVRIVGIMAEQRPGIGQLATEQRDTRLLVQAQIIRLDPGNLQQLGDDAFMHRRILPQVERGEVEAERLDRADQPPERTTAGQRPVALRGQPPRDCDQIGAERLWVGIGFAGQAAGAGRGLAGPLLMRGPKPRLNSRNAAATGVGRAGLWTR